MGDSPFVSISPLHLEQETQGRIHSISHWNLSTGELWRGEASSSTWRLKVSVKIRDRNGITAGGEKCVVCKTLYNISRDIIKAMKLE